MKKRTEIQIIDKKERLKNGFVLSEKTDLEKNTEAFNKESVKDLRKTINKGHKMARILQVKI